MSIDFEAIRRDYPISHVAETLLGVTWDKHKSTAGDLWAPCPCHSESTPSFHVEDAKGQWYCFGQCGEGGDVIKLVQRACNVSASEAARMITGETARTLTPRQPAPIVDPYEGYEFIPAPAAATPITAGKRTPKLRNPKKNSDPTYTPEAVYPYYNADGELIGYDLRVIIEGTKLTPTILWAKNQDWQGWCHGRLDKMPILGLEDVLQWPDKQVLVVEGGKCRDAARDALQGRVVVVSWCGGTNAVSRTDWSPLAGRSLLLWPDHDEGGYKAMHEVIKRAKPKRAKWVKSYSTQKGADVADVVADGLSVPDYIKANISENPLVWAGGILEKKDGMGFGGDSNRGDTDTGLSAGPSGEARSATSAHGPIPDADEQSSRGEDTRGDRGVAAVRGDTHGDGPDTPLDLDDDEWQNYLIHNAKGDGIKSNSIQNAQLIIQYHDNFKGCFAFNEFNREVMLMRKPVWHRGGRFIQRVVNEDDYTALQGHLEYQGISIGVDSIERAVRRVAKHNAFNPVVETLEGLVWDGVERLTGKYGWLTRYMGAAPTEINKIFGRKFLIAGCARIMDPGCQVDTVLIIEGPQGTRKSSSLRALCSVFGNDYFLDSLPDPYSKDGKMAVQGKLIVELAELEAFSRSEVRQEKAYITTRIDEFRRPFGRQVEKFPRTFLLTGSSNPTDTGYLKDSTGGRRFWPVLCGEIDFALLQEDAGQLWAEAYAAYKAGEQWWLTAEEDALAEVEQRARYKHDPWAPLIEEHIKELMLGEVTPNKMLQMLDVSKKDRTVYNNDRVVSILKMLGWKRDGAVYRRPS